MMKKFFRPMTFEKGLFLVQIGIFLIFAVVFLVLSNWEVVGALALCIVTVIVLQREVFREAEQYPDYARQQKIEEEDERNIKVRDRAAYQAYHIFQSVLLFMFVLTLFWEESYLFWGVLGLTLVFSLIFAACKRYNNKRF